MSAQLKALGALGWPHWRRLAERWWRRWVYALTGLVLGFGGLWLLRPEVSEAHAQAEQAAAHLQQQWAKLTPATPKPPDQALTRQLQRHLASLPAWADQAQLWTDWQQVLAAHGLRLQSLQPVAAPPSASTDGRSEAHTGLPHQAAALRVRGRFEDWTRLWAACAEAGPVCSLDRIRVAATEQADDVQIDVTLRLWMRPGDVIKPAQGAVSEEAAIAQAGQADWTAPLLQAFGPRSGVALFVPDSAGGGALVGPVAIASVGASPATASLEVLPPDPQQWPLARVRLAGLWQQGNEHQAILSAGTHWAKVSRGQRVTLEGHRVASISQDGVSLRLAAGPVVRLDWLDQTAAVKSTGGEP